MKDVLCVAVFAAYCLCFMVFVSALRYDGIGVVRAPVGSHHCKTEHSRMQGCRLDALAVASGPDVRLCSGNPSVAHC